MCSCMETTYQHDYKNPNIFQTTMSVVKANEAKSNHCEKKKGPSTAPPCLMYPRMVCYPLMVPPQLPCCPKPCEQPYKWTIKEVKKKAKPATTTCCCGIECRCMPDEPSGTRDCDQLKCRFLQQLCAKYPELFDELKKCDTQLPARALPGCSPPKRTQPGCEEKPSKKSKCANVPCGTPGRSANQWPTRPSKSPKISEYTATISLIGDVIKKNNLNDHSKCKKGCHHNFLLKLKKIE